MAPARRRMGQALPPPGPAGKGCCEGALAAGGGGEGVAEAARCWVSQGMITPLTVCCSHGVPDQDARMPVEAERGLDWEASAPIPCPEEAAPAPGEEPAQVAVVSEAGAWCEVRGQQLEPKIDDTHPFYQEVTCEAGLYRGQVNLSTGDFHGVGCLTSAESVAVGQWRDGHLHGAARELWQDGRRYEGQFARGAFCGDGRMEWLHPMGLMVYEGQYLGDRKHGEGKFTWPSGRSYEGQWVGGKRDGVGLDRSSAGLLVRGLWEDNVFLHPLAEGGGEVRRISLDNEGALASAGPPCGEAAACETSRL